MKSRNILYLYLWHLKSRHKTQTVCLLCLSVAKPDVLLKDVTNDSPCSWLDSDARGIYSWLIFIAKKYITIWEPIQAVTENFQHSEQKPLLLLCSWYDTVMSPSFQGGPPPQEASEYCQCWQRAGLEAVLVLLTGGWLLPTVILTPHAPLAMLYM